MKREDKKQLHLQIGEYYRQMDKENPLKKTLTSTKYHSQAKTSALGNTQQLTQLTSGFTQLT
jgi:hypothetical protein